VDEMSWVQFPARAISDSLGQSLESTLPLAVMGTGAQIQVKGGMNIDMNIQMNFTL
jgi:hypothetical protein